MPAISTIVSSLARESRGELEWTVVLMAGIELPQRGGVADLADDDPVRAHPQRVPHQVADRDLAASLQVGRPRFDPDDMVLA